MASRSRTPSAGPAAKWWSCTCLSRSRTGSCDLQRRFAAPEVGAANRWSFDPSVVLAEAAGVVTTAVVVVADDRPRSHQVVVFVFEDVAVLDVRRRQLGTASR